MNFFEHQKRARSRTGFLVFLYITAVIILAAVIFTAVFLSTDSPELAAVGTGILLLIVLFATLFKTSQLSAGGGRIVAESLGGRLIPPASSNPIERRLYNVVEEMALAAGIPVPAVYLMDNEHSINAFAAGFSPSEAVIGVNRGTVELLTRDELQGVIAHEFSHILNGDMRMNLRLIGILFGIQVLALIGYGIMRIAMYMPRTSSRKGGGRLAIAFLFSGLALMILGYAGVFFSAIIKAAISRQREFLADASAVQFTRNPGGIAGALKKIGCPNVGSNISSEGAAEASHLFFGDVCRMFSLGGLLATHPDLSVRIKAIDPAFDGQFPKQIYPVNITETEISGRTPAAHTPAALASAVLTPAMLSAAENTIKRVPQEIGENAGNPLTAQAVFFAVLMDKDDAVRQKQLAAIPTDYLKQETLRQFREVQALPPELKIPLVQRVTSSLRLLSRQQYGQFSAVVDSLIAADSKMDLFEYTVKALLLRDLDIYFGAAKHLTVRYSRLSAVQEQTALVLSYLAYSGHQTLPEVQNAYNAAAHQLGLQIPLLPADETSPVRFDRSLRVLAETSPELKQKIFDSFMCCVKADGKIVPKESELMRAVAAMLVVPMPQFI